MPIYENRILPLSTPLRVLWIAAILCAMALLARLLVQFFIESWWCSRALLILGAGAASVLVCFCVLDARQVKLRQLDGSTVTFTAQVLACDNMDYGSKYLVQVSGQGQLPYAVQGRLYSYEEPAAEEGDILCVTARLDTTIENYDRSRGIFFYAFAQDGTLVRTEEHQTVRARLLQAAQKLYRAPVLGMVEGVLFGERRNIDETFEQLLEQSGLVHILSVSGIHISMLGAFCQKLCSRFRKMRRFAGLMALVPVWGYIALASFSPSAVRAGVMATLGTLAVLLHREPDALSALGIGAMAIVAVSPYSLYSVSFALSFWITLGILLCTRPLTQVLEQLRPIAFLIGRAGRFEKVCHNLSSTVAASIAATIFSLPLMLCYFQSAAVWSVLSAVIALWAVSPLMLLSMASLGLELLFEMTALAPALWLAKAVAGLAGLFARWILLCGKAVSQLPGAMFYSDSIPVALWGFLTAGLLAFSLYRFSQCSLAQRRLRLRCFAACAAFCFFCVQGCGLIARQGVLYLYQTDGALILTRDGQGAVIGEIESDYRAEQILTLLRCQGVCSLEVYYNSAETERGNSGADLLLSALPVKTVVAPQTGAFYAHLKAASGQAKWIEPQGVSISMLGSVTLRETQEGTELSVFGKRMLKTTHKYGIIEGYSAVFSQTGAFIQEEKGLGAFWSLWGGRAVKVSDQSFFS